MRKYAQVVSLAALAALGLAASPEPASAATANGPICDVAAKVTSTTWISCNGASHTALDISNSTCNVWNYRAMLVGSFRYTYYGGCANSCGTCNAGAGCCNGGAGNYYVVAGANGWDFRQLHVNSNASSGTQTCDRCALGLVGSTGAVTTSAHAHADNRQYGTRKSAWYTSVGTTCGSSGNCSNKVGVPTL